MALSDAERKRLSRARQKAAESEAILHVSSPPSYLRRAFSDFVGTNRNFELDENLDAFGVELRGDFLTEEVQEFETQAERDEPLSSLQRAMGLADVFIDAAKELSQLVNAYKLEEVQRAIGDAEIASANLPRGDVAALKASFAEIKRLEAIQSELRRPTRQTFQSIRSKDE